MQRSIVVCETVETEVEPSGLLYDEAPGVLGFREVFMSGRGVKFLVIRRQCGQHIFKLKVSPSKSRFHRFPITGCV